MAAAAAQNAASRLAASITKRYVTVGYASYKTDFRGPYQVSRVLIGPKRIMCYQ